MPDGAQRKRDGADPPGLRDARDTGDTRETDAQESDPQETDAQRRRRRAQFLRELHEAKALRDRVQPRRVKAARMRQAMRMRTFRW
ncbi:hypothetical protein [Streptomyces sp. NBC_00304]|uniref:hypothetical protein n=1 Tax=unclassified Streptomyces TaxID=2593676 RepID=UPI002E2B4357|nr:hypothetical protein [Streptomyces sp. NBC_00304]